MLTVLSDTHTDLLAVRVTGKLTHVDFDNFSSLVLERINTYGYIRLYFEMQSFEGWEPGSFLEHAVFDVLHRNEYGKIAMVGEREWQRWITLLVDVIKKGKVKFFQLSESHLAMEWIKIPE